MDPIQERLANLRKERAAREKARIEKLRELNLKKYGKTESSSVWSQLKKPPLERPSSTPSNLVAKKKPVPKNNFHINGAYKRPGSGPAVCNKSVQSAKELQGAGEGPSKRVSVFERLYKPKTVTMTSVDKAEKLKTDSKPKTVSMAQIDKAEKLKTDSKPKTVSMAQVDKAEKLKTDSKHFIKVLNNAEKKSGKRHTNSFAKPAALPVRRSISAVHLRRTSKSELTKCIHNWSSVGEKLDKANVNEVEEDDHVDYNQVVSAVKSERKKVKFSTPVSFKYNTPRPEELQMRLKNWLEKHGKSLNSYQHLQCFGIYHMSKDSAMAIPSKPELFDEENKENIALESDSDNQSYTENLNDRKDDFVKENKQDFSTEGWRRASNVSDNTSLNDSKNLTLTSSDENNHVDELLLGALNDLTELLREGFDWCQCARWLRAIRQRFPSAPQRAAYWECRAALEERRGDLPASIQCWEEAFAVGTERSVVEENLDQLLDKFMQLKISPSSGRQKQIDPKMVNVKNVMKSTIIRFAVQKAKMRQSNQHEAGAYTVTPVRRSARLSIHSSSKRTPLQICTTISQASSLGHPVVFVPNDRLFDTP